MAEVPPPIFALAPALAIDGALDYTRGDHAKIYKAGIRQVSDDLFNCEVDNLFQFLKDVQDRTDEMGWTRGILNITLDADEPNEREENPYRELWNIDTVAGCHIRTTIY